MDKLTELTSRLEGPAYAAFRIVAGSMFSVHGMQKLFGWFGAQFQPPAGSQLWFGAIIELTCGVLIALGLFTRAAAFLAAGTMAVAYTQFHWKLQLAGNAWMPVINEGELALLYCFAFLFITMRGSGPFALRIGSSAKSNSVRPGAGDAHAMKV